MTQKSLLPVFLWDSRGIVANPTLFSITFSERLMTSQSLRFAFLLILVLVVCTPFVTGTGDPNAASGQNAAPGQIAASPQQSTSLPNQQSQAQQSPPQRQVVQPGPPGLMTPGAPGLMAPGAPGIIPPPVPPVREVRTALPSDIHFVQIRVIHAVDAGFQESIPQDLTDMRDLLDRAFDYPAFELSNTIRLSLFTDEMATAMVFPDHYLRIVPRSNTPHGLRARLELFHSPSDPFQQAHANPGQALNHPQPDGVRQMSGTPDAPPSSGLFPIVSSAILIRPDVWEAFGGIPMRSANSDESTFGIPTQIERSPSPHRVLRGEPHAGGLSFPQRFLILAAQLESPESTLE